MGHAIHVTFFRNAKATEPVGRDYNPDRLMTILASHTWEPTVQGTVQERKMSVTVGSGARYSKGATRGRDGVIDIDVAAIDLDNSLKVPSGETYCELDGRPSDRPILRRAPVPNPITVAEAADRLRSAGIMGCAYTTLSHTEQEPRTRIYVPLGNAVPVHLWPQAADYLLVHLGLDQRLECVDLQHLRNPAAVAVLPTQPPYGPLLRERVDGDLLQIPLDQVWNRPLLVPPEPEWQRALRVERLARVATLPRPYRIWHGPCDPADLLRELGCTVYRERPWVRGTKCRTTCPWAGEHSGGVDDDSGVIFYPAVGRPVWRCAHSGHAHLGVTDLLRATGRV